MSWPTTTEEDVGGMPYILCFSLCLETETETEGEREKESRLCVDSPALGRK